jgi:hypothetical protein
MTKADQTVERAADKLDGFVRRARAAGGVKAKAAQALADDPEFLRKLKPSLIAARAKGRAPHPSGSEGPSQATPAPVPASGKRPSGSRGGRSPWLVLGVSLAAGYAVAKIIDWRSHAHPHF